MNANWTITQSDALTFLAELPAGSVDLVLFSPPYEDAREYGALKFKLRGQAWVNWMRPIIVEAARVSRGLVLVNAAGKVRRFSYSPIIEMLTADLVRLDGLVCGPSPYAWVKSAGIPGSGAKHYQRRDWEPVYAYARPSSLPLKWSDNTAFGTTPKWGPGGEMSHRLTNGDRRNQWGVGLAAGMPGTRESVRPRSTSRPSHRILSKAAPNGQRRAAGGDFANTGYTLPVIANPGNVVRTKVGGNQLGHPLAHRNEAPYPLALAERFVRWFCPPGGTVCDPFSGSGTTGHAAIIHGRKFLGCDLRDDQVELTRQRLEEVTEGVACAAS